MHFESDSEAVAAKSAELGRGLDRDAHVLVEREIRHVHDHPRLLHPFGARKDEILADAAPAEKAPGTVTVRVTGGGEPLPGAQVSLVVTDGDGAPSTVDGVVGPDGSVSLEVGEGRTPALVYAVPAAAFWSMYVSGPGEEVAVDCPPLPREGPLGWWHRIAGITEFSETRGAGIRVGVADTGCGPNPALGHVVDIGAFTAGGHQHDGSDIGHHGTLVAGLVGARPAGSGQYGGTAPGATLVSARVYAPPGDSANQGDVARAIDALAHQHEVDLLNLSLYSTEPSEIERDAIRAAYQTGTLCVCSAGNTGGAVGYPAAFEEAVAVSGLGQKGHTPSNVVDGLFVPKTTDRMGDDDLYLAAFSCYGDALFAAGPAVATLSTVPVGPFDHGYPYISESGTSCAAPIVCGVLAGVLADSSDYRSQGRTTSRAELARKALETYVRQIGLAANYAGRGLPVSS